MNSSDPFLPKDNQILGVSIKELQSFPDQRGFFREVVRTTDPFFVPDPGNGVPTPHAASFAQWSHSKMARGVVKAWHFHHVQFDWWYVAVGLIEAVLFDNRPESPTFKTKLHFLMGDKESAPANYGFATELCVRIPPGVLHGLKVLSDTAHLFYITSTTYNPDEEGRVPFDSPIVGHNWGSGVIVADRDRRDHTPSSKRMLLS